MVLATCLSGNFQEVGQIRSNLRKITYLRDEMAVRPGIPKFKTHQVIENSPIFSVGMAPTAEDSYNCLVLYKLYRDETVHTNWRAHVIMSQTTTRTKSEIDSQLSRHISDVFPRLAPENQHALPDVQSVCTNLSSHALPHLKK